VRAVQLDLFEERTMRLEACRRALAHALDLETAREELQRFAARHGADAAAEGLLATVSAIGEALAAETARHGDAVAALLGIEQAVPDGLRAGWHRRVALEAERRGGGGCRAGYESAGFHFLRAGDLERAEPSLRAMLERAPGDARSRAHLGDVLCLRGSVDAARVEYLRALIDGPQAVDWEGMADADVAALPSIAATEHAAAGDPRGWSAAVGTVEGVLPWPAPMLAGLGDPRPPDDEQPGLRFYRLLCEERAARALPDRTRIRRSMKALSPSLLQAYLERWR
jgi:hypothetical protein